MDEQIAQFVAITGLDSERAKFFVESAKGDVETALSTFYETEGAQDEAQGDDDDVMASETGHAPTAAAAAATPSTASREAYTGPRTLSGAPAPGGSSSSWGKQAASKSSSSAARAGSGFSASGGMGGIATLHDMRNDDDDGDDDEDEDGNRKKPAHLFTGGEKSGLNVQNPDREQDDGPEIVQNILKKAAEGMKSRGGEGVSQARAEPSQSSSSFAFTGRGRVMGGPSEEEEAEGEAEATPQRGAPFSSADMRALRSAGLFPPNLGSNQGNEEEEEEDEEEIATRHITFWQDGFSIEDGPLCRYDDPQHAETLALINSNRAPLHLLNVKFGQRVDLQVEKKTHKKYQPPPPKPMKPFEGQGNRLGAPAPSMSSAPAASSSSAAPATAPAPAASSSSFQVNPNEPTTRVQIRLGDGQKLVAKFNHTHTVADIRRYINASQPGMAERDYSLQASFPPAPLTDEEQTLSDVGLINSVVTQKWD